MENESRRLLGQRVKEPVRLVNELLLCNREIVIIWSFSHCIDSESLHLDRGRPDSSAQLAEAICRDTTTVVTCGERGGEVEELTQRFKVN